MLPESDPPDAPPPAAATPAASGEPSPGAAHGAGDAAVNPAVAGGNSAPPGGSGKRRRRGRRRGKGSGAKQQVRADGAAADGAQGPAPGGASGTVQDGVAGTGGRAPRGPSSSGKAARPADPDGAGDDHKLQKLLAEAGLGSRRDMEDAITAGRVSVNGKTATLGQRITRRDVVKVDGRAIRLKSGRETPEVLVYHKPAGEIVSHDDPEGRPTVFANLPAPKSGRWISVGRLDFNTEGLLILTNSGELANRLMHPRYEVEREYSVRVVGELTDEQTDALLDGVELDDGPARFMKLEEGEFSDEGVGINRWYRVMIREGRNREVRRMFDAVGAMVSRLIRTRFGPLSLPRSLHRGQARPLTAAEVKDLLRDAPTGKGGGLDAADGAPVVRAGRPGGADKARKTARGKRGPSTNHAVAAPPGRGRRGAKKTRGGPPAIPGAPEAAKRQGRGPGKKRGGPGRFDPQRGSIGRNGPGRGGTGRGGLSRGELTLDGRRPAKPRRRYDDEPPAPTPPTTVIVRRRSRLKIVPPEGGEGG
ncbi:MAG: rRNA pseudouridine synthase [Burkholderiales bacterium]|nr:rRNA pseudouridine synthase [Burkholderiales bacterium]